MRWAAETGTPLVPRAAGTGMPGRQRGGRGGGRPVAASAGSGRSGRASRGCGWSRGWCLARLNAACAPARPALPRGPLQRRPLHARRHDRQQRRRRPLGEVRRHPRAGSTRWRSCSPTARRARAERGARPADPAAARDPRPRRRRPRARTATRSCARWPRVRKNSSGYALREYLESGDAVDLLVGSEGTLALVVGAALRLAPLPAAPRRSPCWSSPPSRPPARPSLALLPEAPRHLRDARPHLPRARPRGRRRRRLPAPPGPRGHPPRGGGGRVRRRRAGGARSAWRARRRRRAPTASPSPPTPTRQAAPLGLRHAASPLIAKRAGRARLHAVHRGRRRPRRPTPRLRPPPARRPRASTDLPAVIFGHAGDGNLHVNPLVDVARPGWRDTLDGVLRRGRPRHRATSAAPSPASTATAACAPRSWRRSGDRARRPLPRASRTPSTRAASSTPASSSPSPASARFDAAARLRASPPGGAARRTLARPAAAPLLYSLESTFTLNSSQLTHGAPMPRVDAIDTQLLAAAAGERAHLAARPGAGGGALGAGGGGAAAEAGGARGSSAATRRCWTPAAAGAGHHGVHLGGDRGLAALRGVPGAGAGAARRCWSATR